MIYERELRQWLQFGLSVALAMLAAWNYKKGYFYCATYFALASADALLLSRKTPISPE